MHHRFVRFHHSAFFKWRHLWSPELVALLLALFVFTVPTYAATRLQERGLLMTNNEPGATTSYTLSFKYISAPAIGSVDMLFCESPIPYEACVTPPGLDVSGAVLVDQTNETGYTISSRSTNHLVLSRIPEIITNNDMSSYKFENIKNPTDTTRAFSIRLRTHTTTDATGTQVDFGSVRGQVQTGIAIEAQVPPMLIFCAAQEVEEGCTGTNDTFFSDLGELAPDSTLVGYSQMAVGTNATAGFAITANGTSMAAGTAVIEPLEDPTESTQGVNQFGINLVENSEPAIGGNPEGTFANAIASPDYGIPNKYKFVSGDVVAFSPNVSLMKKFTVSYIVNSKPTLRAGVYTTTLTFIASGRF